MSFSLALTRSASDPDSDLMTPRSTMFLMRSLPDSFSASSRRCSATSGPLAARHAPPPAYIRVVMVQFRHAALLLALEVGVARV
jgi:hypothetical protein